MKIVLGHKHIPVSTKGWWWGFWQRKRQVGDPTFETVHVRHRDVPQCHTGFLEVSLLLYSYSF